MLSESRPVSSSSSSSSFFEMAIQQLQIEAQKQAEIERIRWEKEMKKHSEEEATLLEQVQAKGSVLQEGVMMMMMMIIRRRRRRMRTLLNDDRDVDVFSWWLLLSFSHISSFFSFSATLFFISLIYFISVLLVSLSHRAAEEQRLDLSSQLNEEKQQRQITQRQLEIFQKDAAEWEKTFHQTAKQAKEIQDRVNNVMETLNKATQDV